MNDTEILDWIDGHDVWWEPEINRLMVWGKIEKEFYGESIWDCVTKAMEQENG